MCIGRLVLVLNLFFICLLVKHEITACFVQYHPNRETWFDARTFCNRLGGRLANTEDILNCNQSIGSINSSPGSTYWTGEYKTISHWISKIGCLEILGKPNVTHAYSVSKCFEDCRKHHIKLKFLAHIGNKCVCVSENIPSLGKIVGIYNCRHSLYSDNHYWAYTVTRNTTLNGTGNCAVVDCGNQPKIYTENCEKENIQFCDDSFRSNWDKTQENCKDHTIPVDLMDICKTLPYDHRYAWLPMQRVVFWTKVTCDEIGIEENVTECESYHCYDNGGVSTLRVITPCREKTDGLYCAFSSPYNMTTDRTKTMANSTALCPGILKSTDYHNSSYERTLKIDHIICKNSLSTIINQSTMLQSTTRIITPKQNDNKNFTEISEQRPNSNKGLIVGGVLGALAIIGVVILVLILKLRRTQASSKRQNIEQSEIRNEDHQRNNLSNNIRVNQLYEDEGAHADRPVPMRSKEADISIEQTGKKPNDVYAVVMKNNNPSPLQVVLQPEVASAEAVESEYDRLNITPTCLRDNMVNNLYDSSIAERCESDPTYNTATNTRHSRINTENVYN